MAYRKGNVLPRTPPKATATTSEPQQFRTVEGPRLQAPRPVVINRRALARRRAISHLCPSLLIPRTSPDLIRLYRLFRGMYQTKSRMETMAMYRCMEAMLDLFLLQTSSRHLSRP